MRLTFAVIVSGAACGRLSFDRRDDAGLASDVAADGAATSTEWDLDIAARSWIGILATFQQ